MRGTEKNKNVWSRNEGSKRSWPAGTSVGQTTFSRLYTRARRDTPLDEVNGHWTHGDGFPSTRFTISNKNDHKNMLQWTILSEKKTFKLSRAVSSVRASRYRSGLELFSFFRISGLKINDSFLFI